MSTNRNYNLKAVLSCQDQLSEKLRTVRKNLGVLDRSFKTVTASAGALASRAFAPLMAIGGAGLLSVGASVRTFIELGDSIDKAAIRAGAATGALQKLRFAAKLSGMDAQEMDKALSKLSTQMGRAASGDNKKLVSLFDQLGISWKDSTGRARDSAAVMRELADAVKANADPATQLQILTDVFGDDLAARLLPALKDGAEGLDAMAAKAEELGVVISGDDVAQAAKLGDTFDIFRQVTGSLSMTIGARLAPALIRIIEKIQAVIVANRQLIAQRVAEVCENLAAAIESVDFAGIVNGFITTAKAAFTVFQWLGGVKTVLYLVAGVMAGKALISALAFGQAVFGLVKAVAAFANPWLLVAGAVIAAASFIITNWDEIKQAVADGINYVSGVLEDFFGPKIEALQAFGAAVKENLAGALAPVAAAWEGIKAAVSPVLNWFDEKLKGIAGIMPGWLRDLVSGGAPGAAVPAVAGAGVGMIPAYTGANGRARVEVVVKAADGAQAKIDDVSAQGTDLTAAARGGYDPGDSF